MSNNKKQQKTKTFKLSEFEPKPRSYDIINLSNIKGAFFQINFILEYLSDGVFEYLEDHLEEDKLMYYKLILKKEVTKSNVY